VKTVGENRVTKKKASSLSECRNREVDEGIGGKIEGGNNRKIVAIGARVL